MSGELYFDDLRVGLVFPTDSYTITLEEAIAFAREYDPQYFHVDEEAAKHSPFGKLAVSGWHSSAITMRLKAGCGLNKVAGGLVGMGIESLKWPKPVYPGDTLRVVITITSARRSQSKPTHGVVKYHVDTLNQDDEIVMQMDTAIWVPC